MSTTVADYTTRSWDVHTLPPGAWPADLLERATNLTTCESTSPMAQGDQEDLFLIDLECAAAGIQPHMGGSLLSRLTRDWEGYPAGTLAFYTYEGVDGDPMTFKYVVERIR